ncbi:T9SS type A sorting domain-containing protein [Ekhidna sp.]|uniref:T9SS type A sorting domain-containing protein n=1 Tax=Ekhidna sp. TaxID=2608089 RepID=UPI0032EF0276
MRRKYLLAISIFMAIFSFGQTKTESIKDINSSNTNAVFLGKTERIDKLVGVPTTSSTKRDKNKAKKAQPNFFGRGTSKVKIAEVEHQGPDPIRQIQTPDRTRVIIEPIVNIEGITNGSDPQDPTGAIGSNYYLQAINATSIGIFQKDGTLEQEFSANTLWSPLGESSLGDPIILFDQAADRWLITEFADPANLLIAMSETNDPQGSYYVYSFSTPDFPDYPKYAIWSDSYTVTTNESGTNALHQYFIDRDALIAGNEDVTIQRVEIGGNTNTEAGFYVTTPVDWNGDTAPVDNKPMVVKINDSSWGDVEEDVLEIYTFEVDFDDPDNTTTTLTSIITTPFDGYPCAAAGAGFACVPQKDGDGLDAIPEVIMNVPHYRNFDTHESIVLNFITDATDGENISGIRWMELRRSGGDWELYQEGTFAPDDGLHRYMGSIAMDGNGNIGLAYNVSGDDEYVGIRFTGRFANDPLGIMTVQEYEVVAGLNPIISGTRFGDYAQMNVDPSDDLTFWYTSEYAGNGTDDATTRIFSFQLERRDNDLAAVKVISPEPFASLSSSESITVEISNTGEMVASNFDIQLIVDGVDIVTDTYTGSLDPQEDIEYTFSSPVDLGALGEYGIQFKIIYDADEAEENDSYSVVVKNIPTFDAGVDMDLPDESCTDVLSGNLSIINNGATTMTSLDINLFVNDDLQETIEWIGSLETNEIDLVEIAFESLDEGNNDLKVTIENPNSEEDQLPADNELVKSVNHSLESEQITLYLTTDNYPEETTWEILDEENNVVESGGPYTSNLTTYSHVVCLETDKCYTFEITDSEGDGICCDYGEGSYYMDGEDGEVIFEDDGQFGSVESTEFCFKYVCNLTAAITKVDASSTEGGAINISASGGFGYEYSIDGGQTFVTDPMFSDLEEGTYQVVINSDDGQCVYEETVDIFYILGAQENLIEGLKIFPNPTNGVFKISLSDHTYINGFLKIEVLDLNGRVIQYRKLSRYGGSFEGTLSLYAYPDGVYFLKLVNVESDKLVRIIKQ